MSEFHYVRTTGPDGGVDAAEGSAIGLDLESVLDAGLPPFNVAIQITAAVAEILAIAAEDGVVHGDLDLGDVFIDDTGAVSVEGFGQTETLAPERRPVGPETDRFGLGMVAYALFSPRDLPEMPDDENAHEDACIDAVLALNFEGLPEDLIGDIQWYITRLLAWEPSDRPTTLEAWRAFGTMFELVDGPDFVSWCNDALDGNGERRDQDLASRPMQRPLHGGLEDTTRSGGPLPKGAVNFEAGGEDPGKNTMSWTREGMKKALQRVLSSDYMEDPNTDWMPGTPIPPMDRLTGPGGRWQGGSAPVPKRAPGEAKRRHTSPRPSTGERWDAPPEDPISRPLPSDFDLVPDQTEEPDDDGRTEVGNMVVPTSRPPTPKPRPARKYEPPVDSPTVPAPGISNRPARPRREVAGPAEDPDTVPPQLVKRPPPPTRPPMESEPPAPERQAPMSPEAISPADEAHYSAPTQRAVATPPPAPQQRAQPAAPAPMQAAPAAPGPSAAAQGPIPEYVPRGPDPFADVEEEEGPNLVLIGGIALMLVVSLVFCIGVGGVGGLAAVIGMPQGSQQAAAPRPQPRIVKADPQPSAGIATEPSPQPFPRPVARPSPSAPSPRPVPSTPRPTASPTPSPSTTLPSMSAQPSSVRPTSVRPVSPVPSTPLPSPMPSPMPMTAAPQPSMVRPSGPSSTGVTSLPPLPPVQPAGDSILPYLVPEPSPNPDGSGPSMLQKSMRAHLTTATAARDAVINGNADAARQAARRLEFLNQDGGIPPDWLPYVADMQMEAWLMENSPDLAAAGFKVAQIGQSCSSCHEGTRAGPTVTPGAVPDRIFAEQDVMKRHAWAVDWMWIGLLANDQAAWSKGANELAEAPFPSVILQDLPEQKFMDLEDKLHSLAVEGQTATSPDKRAVTFGRMLATCARCHKVYRENKTP